VALKIEMNETELSRKLNGERGWKISELQKVCDHVGLRLVGTEVEWDGEGDFDLLMGLAKKLAETMRTISIMKGVDGKNNGNRNGTERTSRGAKDEQGRADENRE